MFYIVGAALSAAVCAWDVERGAYGWAVMMAFGVLLSLTFFLKDETV